MKCVICHGEQIEVMQVNEEINLGSDIVYVPVEVSVCKTCGERYYDRRTMQFLEDVEKKVHSEDVELKEVGRVLVYG